MRCIVINCKLDSNAIKNIHTHNDIFDIDYFTNNSVESKICISQFQLA